MPVKANKIKGGFLMKKVLLVLLSVVLVIGLAVGCTPPTPDIAAGGVIRLGLGANPDVMNPILYRDSPTADVITHIFQGMMRYDENFNLIGSLADSWEYDEDNMGVTFHLKKGVKWHDGEDFTSADVEFTFATMMHPEYPGVRGTMFETIDEIIVIDEHTIRFTVKEQFGPLMNNLAFSIIPKHIFSVDPATGNPFPVADLMNHPNNSNNVVGTGPYKWKSWQANERIVLERNENYHVEGEPYFEEVVITIYGGTEAMMMALEVGELDYAAVAANKVADMQKKGQNGDGTFNLITHDALSYTYLALNQREDLFGAGKVNPFRDLRVRQAIAHAAPIQDMIDSILDGNGYRLYSNIPRSSWAYNEEGLTKYDYNLEEARRLLDEAGWTLKDDQTVRTNEDGQRLEFELATNADNDMRMQVITIMEEELSKIGVKANLRGMEWQAFLNHVTAPNKNGQAFVLGWSLSVDPDPYSIFHSSSRNNWNFIDFVNEDVDFYIMQGRRNINIDVRKEAYHNLAKVISRELPYIFLYGPSAVTAVNSDIDGYVLGDTGLFFFERWYYKSLQAE